MYYAVRCFPLAAEHQVLVQQLHIIDQKQLLQLALSCSLTDQDFVRE